ncbi:MAG: hypothetical protein ACPG5L_14720 [Vibrio gallaecicus]
MTLIRLIVKHRVAVFISLLALTYRSSFAQTDEDNHLKIVTVIPVVASMTEELVKGTNITVKLLPPLKYNIKRIPGWLERQPSESYPIADAVIGISSIWSNVDAYPALRNQNIAIIPIDIAQALIPKGERVAVLSSQGKVSSYFWLNPANALVMLGILHRDLSLILDYKGNKGSKEETQRLNANFAQMNKSLRQSQITFDNIIFNSESMQVIVNKPELKGLASATLLPLVERRDAIEDGLQTLLVTNRKVHHSSLKELPENIVIWSVDDFAKQRKGSFTERWKMNMKALPSN